MQIRGGGLLSLFAKTPLSVLVNGNVAVQYFFILTGFLAARTAKNKYNATREEVVKKCIQRYFRLFSVVSLAIIFTFITMVLGLQFHLEIANKVINKEFLLEYCNFAPTIKSLFADLFWRTYTLDSQYVGPFWTIRYEFLGYIICLLVCWLTYNSRWRRCIYLICAIICYTQLGENYIMFFIGVTIADLWYTQKEKDTIFQKYYANIIQNKIFLLMLSLLGIYLMCCPIYYVGIYKIFEGASTTTGLIRGIGVGLLLYVLLNCKKFQKCFETSILKWVGKISFELYAFHWPVMLIVQAGLFKIFITYLPYRYASICSFAITIPIIIVSAYLIWYLIEKKQCFNVWNIMLKRNNRHNENL